MSQPIITVGGQERLASAVALYDPVFRNDPVITYMLASLSPERRDAYRPSYFQALLKAATLNKGAVYEAGDWGCCGIFMPPLTHVDNPFTIFQAGFLGVLYSIGIRGAKRMLMEYEPKSLKFQKLALKGQKKYYYIFFVGTRDDRKKEGLCSAMMKQWQDVATKEQVPIWLEATTAYSKDLYLRLGWEVVGEFCLGEGISAPDGTDCAGGKGVPVWGMIWWPKTVTQEG